MRPSRFTCTLIHMGHVSICDLVSQDPTLTSLACRLEQDVGIIAATIPTLRPLLEAGYKEWSERVLSLCGISWPKGSFSQSRRSGFRRTGSSDGDWSSKKAKKTSNNQVVLRDLGGITKKTDISARSFNASADKVDGDRGERPLNDLV